ncbi:MAG: carboxypeptidase regulatory-like domain-containing protein, partial [Geobacteraceae bacterium]|nr:carboxypeptidase regulatory-like domain-containing protein [Geobacteraceae bacterium]
MILLVPFTGMPVAGVAAVQTDSNTGNFFINNIPTGDYKLYFSAGPGYQSEFYNDQTNFNTAQLLTVNSGDNINSINAVLTAALNTGSIVGHVANASNSQPVANAMVELLDATNSTVFATIFTIFTGDFQISAVPPGSYRLRISASGYRTIAPVTQYLIQS